MLLMHAFYQSLYLLDQSSINSLLLLNKIFVNKGCCFIIIIILIIWELLFEFTKRQLSDYQPASLIN